MGNTDTCRKAAPSKYDAQARVVLNGQRGFTLIELMVGMTLGLLASLAIFTAVSSFETQRRVTASGADMQQNGLLALYFLEQDLRMAGFGMIDASTTPGSLPCVKLNNVSVAPVSIVDGGAGSDTLTTHRLDSDTGGIVTGGQAAMLTSALSSITSITTTKVDTNQAIHLNDYLLIPDAARNCSQLKATALPAIYATIPGTPAVLATATTPAVAAVPSALAPAFATIINLGQTAVAIPAQQYQVDANFNLNHTNDGGASWSPVASNIANIQFQYGVATAGSQSVACWTDASGTACGGTDWANPPAADINRIKAIRVAIVARSSNKTACTTTTANPVSWTQPVTNPVSSAAPAINLSTSVGADWRCYRYKVYQTIIPIRNVIWGNL